MGINELLNGLHGGIALTERTKLHPKAEPGRPLLVLGEYCRSNQTGRHIMLYGGSILRVYGGYDDERLRAELDSLHEIVKRTGLLHYDTNNPNRQKELPVSRMLPKVRAGYTNVIFKLSKVLGAVVNEEDLGLDDYE